MTAVAQEILGLATDAGFLGLDEDHVDVEWFDAGKPRLHLVSERGLEIRTSLPRGSFLAQGSVLRAQGGRMVVVRRKPARACRVTFDESAPGQATREEAALVAHAAGNQHVPIDPCAGELRMPVLTSDEVMAKALGSLGLTTASFSFEMLALFLHRPPSGTGHAP